MNIWNLNLPDEGLVIVAGYAGIGKSYAMIEMANELNQNVTKALLMYARGKGSHPALRYEHGENVEYPSKLSRVRNVYPEIPYVVEDFSDIVTPYNWELVLNDIIEREHPKAIFINSITNVNECAKAELLSSLQGIAQKEHVLILAELKTKIVSIGRESYPLMYPPVNSVMCTAKARKHVDQFIFVCRKFDDVITHNDDIEIIHSNELELFVSDNKTALPYIPEKYAIDNTHEDIANMQAIYKIHKICLERAESIFGENIPAFVSDRINDEITKLKYSNCSNVICYELAYKIACKCDKLGYAFNCRGAVGSSFIAYLLGITKTNPLPECSYCPKCHKAELLTDSTADGRKCPECGEICTVEGNNIPCEMFMGYDGSRKPDIEIEIHSEDLSKILLLIDEYKNKPDYDPDCLAVFSAVGTEKHEYNDYKAAINELGLSHAIFEERSRNIPFAFRDDIMNYLAEHGIDRKLAYEISENTGKGKSNLILTEQNAAVLRSGGISDDYIAALRNVIYLFPKAHAIEYYYKTKR